MGLLFHNHDDDYCEPSFKVSEINGMAQRVKNLESEIKEMKEVLAKLLRLLQKHRP